MGKHFQAVLHWIPPIGWFIAALEGVKFLMMSDEEFDVRYNYSTSEKALLAEKQRLMRQKLINQRKALERQHFLEEKKFKESL